MPDEDTETSPPKSLKGKSGSLSLLDALRVLLVMLIAFPSPPLQLILIDQKGEKSLFFPSFFSEPDLSDIFHCVLVPLTDLLKKAA